MTTFVNNDVASGTVIQASDHNTQGALIAAVVNGNVDSGNLASNSVTTVKIADSNVTTAKIADGAVTSSKIDSTTLFLGRSTPNTNQTTSGTTKLTLTGSSLVINAVGNYRILFLVTIPLLSGTVVGDRFVVSVEDGGTPIGGIYFVVKQTALGDTLSFSVVTASNVSAGSHTYTLSITRDVGTGTISTNAATAAASIAAMVAA